MNETAANKWRDVVMDTLGRYTMSSDELGLLRDYVEDTYSQYLDGELPDTVEWKSRIPEPPTEEELRNKSLLKIRTKVKKVADLVEKNCPHLITWVEKVNIIMDKTKEDSFTSLDKGDIEILNSIYKRSK